MAETLNKFFTGFEYARRGSGVKRKPDLTYIQQNLPPKSTLSLKKTNPMEVNEVMNKIKTNKATGCDRIPPPEVK